MGTVLAISFPWGRYHATPWDRHVNEGAIDWPPSPWRLLRSLYATWKTRRPDLTEAEVLGLLGSLTDPPRYWLPKYREAHTRHYMPDLEHRSGATGNTDKVLDAFVVTERGAELAVEWAVDLDASEHRLLADLASSLPYLGRAESLCEARLAEAPPREGSLLEPVADGEAVAADVGTIRLLGFGSPLAEAVLTTRTADVRRERLRRPAGTVWVQYRKPEPSVGGQRRATPPLRAAVTGVRWSISANALPARFAAVAMCDVLRRACLGVFGRRNGGATSPTLAGKDSAGRPLTGHQHAHYFALDTDDDGLLDHVALWVPGGLRPDDISALAELDNLRGHGFIEDFRACALGLEALGPVAAVLPELVGPSRKWRSFTPFAPGRHGRRVTPWVEHAADQVTAELAWRGLPTPTHVVPVAGDSLEFRRHRPTTERLRDARRTGAFDLTFADPVSGPLALGSLSHFGLGLFLPVAEVGPLYPGTSVAW